MALIILAATPTLAGCKRNNRRSADLVDYSAFKKESEVQHYLEVFSATTTKNWRLEDPTDIAADDLGNVYVIDTSVDVNEDRSVIYKLNQKDELVSVLSLTASEGIVSIDIDKKNNVYVHNHEICYIYGSNGNLISSFIPPDRSIYFDFDKYGFIYFLDHTKAQVKKYDPRGKFIAKWEVPVPPFKLYGIYINSYIYITGENYIYVYNLNGSLVSKWIEFGGSKKEIIDTGPLAFDQNNDVYIAGEYRVLKFTENGDFIKHWGKPGSAKGQFYGTETNAVECDPVDIAVSAEGYVYAVDSHNKRIQKFTSDGKFLAEIKGGR